MIGKGKKKTLTAEELKSIREFLQAYDLIEPGESINTTAMMYGRAYFKTEIHSHGYNRNQFRDSSRVAIQYAGRNGIQEEFFGQVQIFLMFNHRQRVHRLAFVKVFYNKTPTEFKTPRVDQTREYKSGNCIPVNTIDRRVIFCGRKQDTRILEAPVHLSRS